MDNLRMNPYHGFGPTRRESRVLLQKTYETKLEMNPKIQNQSLRRAYV